MDYVLNISSSILQIYFFALYCIHTNHEVVQNIKCTLCVAESVSIKDNYRYMNLASLKLQ